VQAGGFRATAWIRFIGAVMQLNYVTVDVFTDRPFGGNPLAVVPDARGVTSEQMQTIASEFNLS
jgi:trans-2,3-dihydro-3-hydroxyanthranilate isomerase